jgi:hypothetical protein
MKTLALWQCTQGQDGLATGMSPGILERLRPWPTWVLHAASVTPEPIGSWRARSVGSGSCAGSDDGNGPAPARMPLRWGYLPLR